MAKTRPGMMFYFEDWDIPRKILDHIQFKVLFDALYDYARDGVIPDMIPDDTVRVFFDTFRQKVDRDAERYNDTCRKRSEAGKKAHSQQKPPLADEDGNSQPTSTSDSNSYSTSTSDSNSYSTSTSDPYSYQKQPQYQSKVNATVTPVTDDDDLPF